MDTNFATLQPLLDQAISQRLNASSPALSEPSHEGAFRLFNGFYEGFPDLVLDVYGETLVLHDYSKTPNPAFVQEIINHARATLPWLHTGVLKTRHGASQKDKRGTLIFGDEPNRKIKENGVWYAIDLTMNRDASFYLDTVNLRKWLMENSRGKSVLNTFAYTGSLGVAALAGGATKVIQTDLNRQFLNLAKDSYTLNGFPVEKPNFISQDFFSVIARFKAGKQAFDCVIIDPPFFSSTSRGKVDMEHESERLINKVRPLIQDGGTLIAINNAVFLNGKEYMQTLESLCKDGYLSIRELIPVPDDFIGIKRAQAPITDPAPFNHSTKIAILDVRRK